MQDWGVSQPEAEERIGRQDQIARFADLLATHFPLAYGGTWIDQARGGIVVVNVLTPGVALEAAPAFGLAGLVEEVPGDANLGRIGGNHDRDWRSDRESRSEC